MRSLVVALLLLIPVALFFACFEKREVEVATPASPEAQANRFLALGRLLSEMGHEVRVLRGPQELEVLPSENATLFLLAPRRSFDSRRVDTLLAWVSRGGHLVLAGPGGDGDAGGPIVQRLSLAPSRPDWQPDAEAVAEAVDEPVEALGAVFEGGLSELFSDPTTLWWPEIGHVVVDFDGRYGWLPSELEREREARSDAGTLHLVQIASGAGTVTALSDAEFLSNDRIGTEGHGFTGLSLARAVGSPLSKSAAVWLLIGEDWPGLVDLILERAPSLVLALALLGVGVVWRAGRRFGPPAPISDGRRRSWLEHLEAVGRHHWRQDRGQQLLDGLQAGVHAAVELRHPNLARLPRDELHERLARGCGLRSVDVARALDAETARSERASFIARVDHLERIRASL